MNRPILARQRGLSAGGWFMVVVIVLGLASLVVRLLPFYIDHNTMKGVIEQLLDTPSSKSMTERGMERELVRRFKMNNIRDFDVGEALDLLKRDGKMAVDYQYEVREPLFYNIDVVLKFEEHYERTL